MYLIYSLLTVLLLPWGLLHLALRARRQPEYLRHWRERFGFYSAPAQTSPCLWIHAVSVGETRAAQPVLMALRERFPGYRIVMTHMTPTGRATSEALFGDSLERVYLPWDTPWGVRRFLAHFQPRFGLIMETELWPNLLRACHAGGIPVHLVNARLSLRSARGYARFARLTAATLSKLTSVCAQTADDARHLQALGAGEVCVTGNVKFDIVAPADQLECGRRWRARCGTRAIWLAASTREGEEALIFEAWRKVGAGKTANALLVIVPRHPQRFAAVAQMAVDAGFLLQRRSDGADIDPATEVLLGDSMGEMFAYYAMADVAFIGGSLRDFGSQNLIEACAVGTPVLVGPSTHNFAQAAEGAIECGAAIRVADADSLIATVCRLLADPPARLGMGRAGRAFAEAHRGATAKTLAVLAGRI